MKHIMDRRFFDLVERPAEVKEERILPFTIKHLLR